MASRGRSAVWGLLLLGVGIGMLIAWGIPPLLPTATGQGRSEGRDLATRVQQLEEKLACLTTQGNDIVFEKCNVHIRNGTGKTDGVVNGTGNLIIGYNEHATGTLDRTGSHNLVIGPEHVYTSYGGFVAGYENTISAPHASVSGGKSNTASGMAASVSGGSVNKASKALASVSGGKSNTANGDAASVSGGVGNAAPGEFSSVSGGSDNTATGFVTSISGGSGNEATGSYASISGGKRRNAPEQDNWRAGTLLEKN